MSSRHRSAATGSAALVPWVRWEKKKEMRAAVEPGKREGTKPSKSVQILLHHAPEDDEDDEGLPP